MNKVTNLIQLAYRAGKVAKGDSLLVSIQKQSEAGSSLRGLR